VQTYDDPAFGDPTDARGRLLIDLLSRSINGEDAVRLALESAGLNPGAYRLDPAIQAWMRVVPDAARLGKLGTLIRVVSASRPAFERELERQMSDLQVTPESPHPHEDDMRRLRATRNKDGELRKVLFIAYASEDRDTCRQVVAFLSIPAKRLGYEVWWDQFQQLGEPWSEQADAQLSRTGAAIVLVSIDALHSEFIWEKEVGPLLREGVPVAPLLVRHCPWEDNEYLRTLQFLAAPDDDLIHSDLEPVLANIARRLHTWLPRLEDEQEPEIARVAKQRTPVDQLPKQHPGDLHSVPSLPAEYQARTDLLNDFRAQLLGSASGVAGITAPQRVGLLGVGGVGKSVFASALAHDLEVRCLFPDGIYWITVGQYPDIPSLQAKLAAELKIDISDARTNTQRRTRLAAAIGDRRCLVIVDDVWSGDGALSFNLSGPYTRVLFTTRNEQILTVPELRATPLVVPPLSLNEAISFVRSQIGSDVELPAEALEVIEQTGRVVLPLSLAVGARLNGLSWATLRDRFMAASQLYPEELEGNFRAMRVALSTLEAEEIERYSDLVVFPPDESIPITTIETFWSIYDLSARDLLDRFHQGRLLEIDGEDVRFHDDQILYLSGRTSGQTARHVELLDAHRPSSGEWRDLPRDDRYMWDHLAYHLVEAMAFMDQDRLCRDIDWITQHWFLNGPRAVERDLRMLAPQKSPRHNAHHVLRRVRRIGHLMRGMNDLPSIANTFAVHFADLEMTGDISRHASPDWLSPSAPIASATDALERVIPGHQHGALAVSAVQWRSAWQLASAGADGAVRLWDAFAPDKEPSEIGGHEAWVTVIHVFRWQGDLHCATGSDDRRVRIWSLNEPGNPVLEVRGHMGSVTAITVFEEGDESFLCVGSADRHVRVRRLSDGELVSTFRGHSGTPRSVVAHRDGDGWRITSGGSDGVLRTWDPLSGKNAREIHSIRCDSPVTSLATFTEENSRRFVAGHENGTLSIWSLDGTGDQVIQAHKGEVRAVTAFEDHGVTSLISASADGAVELRRDNDGFTVSRSYRGHLKSVDAISVFLAGDTWHLASASMDETIRIWDLGTHDSDVGAADGHSGRVTAIAECRLQGEWAIVTAGEDATVRVWRCTEPRVSAAAVFQAAGPLSAITTWDDDESSVIYWGTQDGSIGSAPPPVNNIISGQGTSAVTGMCSYVTRNGERMLVTASKDRAVRIWNCSNLSDLPALLREHGSHINDISVFELKDQPKLLTASSDHTLLMWDLEETERFRLVDVHPAEIHAVTVFLSESGWAAVTGADDGIVRVIDLEGDTSVREIGRHAQPVTSVAVVHVAEGDLRIASASEDGRVALWNPRTGDMTARVGLGGTVSDLCPTSTPGALAVAYDAGWTLIRCTTPTSSRTEDHRSLTR